MQIEQIRRAHDAKPFDAFTVCLTDGQRIPVRHPEYLYIAPGPVRAFVLASEDGTYRVVDALLVTTLEFASGRARKREGSGPNGRKRKP